MINRLIMDPHQIEIDKQWQVLILVSKSRVKLRFDVVDVTCPEEIVLPFSPYWSLMGPALVFQKLSPIFQEGEKLPRLPDGQLSCLNATRGKGRRSDL